MRAGDPLQGDVQPDRQFVPIRAGGLGKFRPPTGGGHRSLAKAAISGDSAAAQIESRDVGGRKSIYIEQYNFALSNPQ
jgi:hypothetical protein